MCDPGPEHQIINDPPVFETSRSGSANAGSPLHFSECRACHVNDEATAPLPGRGRAQSMQMNHREHD